MIMATFARSNRGLFGAIVGFVVVLFFVSVYHVSGGDYDVDRLVNKFKGGQGHAGQNGQPGNQNAESPITSKPPPPDYPGTPPPPPPPPPPAKRPSFYDIGKKYGTDKVGDHHYNNMYDKYLEPMRDRPLKMLEIGLGCNMIYGPGASYHTWLEYLPNVDLYYIEYDAACAAKWADKTKGATIFTGDQADVPFLKDFLAKTGGNFDVIIDDGGHTMNQQITSMNELIDSVVPGGLYFVEDLNTSYLPQYGGGLKKEGTFMEQVKTSLDGIMLDVQAPEFMNRVAGIDCMHEVCCFTKRFPDRVY